MRRLIIFLAALAGSTVAIPFQPLSLGTNEISNFTIVHPGSIEDIIILKENTLNSTHHASNDTGSGTDLSQNGRQLRLSLANNFSGGAVNAYITGLNSNNQIVMLGPDGQWVYPSSGGSSTPVLITQNVAIPLTAQHGTRDINLPDYISAARVWFAEGELKFFMVATPSGDGMVMPSAVNPSDPSADINWGFVELTNNSNGLNANISYVDFVGMVLGMTLTNSDGSSQTTPGLQVGSVPNICNELVSQTNSDGQVWNKLCFADAMGTPLRVLSPTDYGSLHSTAFAGYYDSYVDAVWSNYAAHVLQIDTQTSYGVVNCQVGGNVLTCNGDNRGYSKPVISDIWGCNSGPFEIQSGDNDVHRAVVPRLCAAFVRSTLLLAGGNTQPGLGASNYYTSSPTNHYSRIVHRYEINSIGYAFPYDDVAPGGVVNSSGDLASGDPESLTIFVGAPPASS